MSGRFGRVAQDLAVDSLRTPNVSLRITADIDGRGKLAEMMETIKNCCEQGAGTTVTIETGDGVQGEFYFDGDGADRILTIEEADKR